MILAYLFCASTTTGISRSTTSTSPLTTSWGSITATLFVVSSLGASGGGAGSSSGIISGSGLTTSMAGSMSWYWQQRCSAFFLQLTTSLWQILGFLLDFFFFCGCFLATTPPELEGLNSGLPFFKLARLADGFFRPSSCSCCSSVSSSG